MFLFESRSDPPAPSRFTSDFDLLPNALFLTSNWRNSPHTFHITVFDMHFNVDLMWISTGIDCHSPWSEWMKQQTLIFPMIVWYSVNVFYRIASILSSNCPNSCYFRNQFDFLFRFIEKYAKPKKFNGIFRLKMPVISENLPMFRLPHAALVKSAIIQSHFAFVREKPPVWILRKTMGGKKRWRWEHIYGKSILMFSWMFNRRAHCVRNGRIFGYCEGCNAAYDMAYAKTRVWLLLSFGN